MEKKNEVKEIQKTLPPNTTAQQDLTFQGQRKINMIWEVTQAIIALAVVITGLFVSGSLVMQGRYIEGAFLLLSNSFFLVVGFYFGRTNHEKTGGVGAKPDDRR